VCRAVTTTLLAPGDGCGGRFFVGATAHNTMSIVELKRCLASISRDGRRPHERRGETRGNATERGPVGATGRRRPSGFVLSAGYADDSSLSALLSQSHNSDASTRRLRHSRKQVGPTSSETRDTTII
jgi:hypothetical protein